MGEAQQAARAGVAGATGGARSAARLWDAEAGLFLDRRRGGRFIRHATPTSFYPLFTGAATDAQAETMAEVIADEEAPVAEQEGGPVVENVDD